MKNIRIYLNNKWYIEIILVESHTYGGYVDFGSNCKY